MYFKTLLETLETTATPSSQFIITESYEIFLKINCGNVICCVLNSWKFLQMYSNAAFFGTCSNISLSVCVTDLSVCLFPCQFISMFSAFSTHRTLAVQVRRWGTEKTAEPGEVPAERPSLAEREWSGEQSGWSKFGSVTDIYFVSQIIRQLEIHRSSRTVWNCALFICSQWLKQSFLKVKHFGRFKMSVIVL